MVCRSVKLVPPFVLRYKTTALRAALMLTRKRLPNSSHDATSSQQEAPIPVPAGTHVAPPSVLRKNVVPGGLNAANTSSGFVGLTAIVPSAWLPFALLMLTFAPTVMVVVAEGCDRRLRRRTIEPRSNTF